MSKARERDLGSAIGHYFAYRVGMLERDLSDLFRVGWRFLAIGIAVLAVCIGLSQIVRRRSRNGLRLSCSPRGS